MAVMRIGVPKEVKVDEFRVGATPENVKLLVDEGHEVFVERSAGIGSGFSDDAYVQCGAILVNDAQTLYGNAELIVKVKEPQPSEYDLLQERHTLFCYLHLAPLKELTSVLLDKKLCAIAYETVLVDNELPLLKPMSEIAGKMSVTVAAHHLSRYEGGSGVLISGASGVEAANVLVVGAGNAGEGAVKTAYGLGANVTVVNRSSPKLEILSEKYPGINTVLFSSGHFEELVRKADVVIGSVLSGGGGAAPKLISEELLKEMKKGSVLVDIMIDQGGISQSSHPTTHTDPTYIDEGVVHYCVANMPGAYPKTSTVALTKATFEYVREIANKGVVKALQESTALQWGVNVYGGHMTNATVSEVFNLECVEIKTLLN